MEDESSVSTYAGSIILVLIIIMSLCGALYYFWHKSQELKKEINTMKSSVKNVNLKQLLKDIDNMKALLFKMQNTGDITKEMTDTFEELVTQVSLTHDEAIEFDRYARDNYRLIKDIITEMDRQLKEKERIIRKLQDENIELRNKLT